MSLLCNQTAPPCNRRDQERAGLGPDGTGFLRRSRFGQENFTASGRWCLTPTLRLRFSLRSRPFVDGQPVRLDLNPGDMIVDEDGVRDLGGVVEVTPNRFCDEGLDLVCRNPADGSRLVWLGPAARRRRDSIGIWCLASGHGWGSSDDRDHRRCGPIGAPQTSFARLCDC